MVLRDKRLWMGVVAAIVLAFVSYAVVSGIGHPSNTGDTVGQQAMFTASPASSTSSGPAIADTDAIVPSVLGERLNQAKSQLTNLGLSNVRVEDVTGHKRPVLEDNNWIVERQSPAADLAVDKHTLIVLGVRKPTDAHSPQATAPGTVPDVVCANLQDAQDALRRAGFLILTSKDGSGQQRLVLVDRNWVVIGQSVKAGTQPGLTTHIELTVVKYGEPTHNPDCES